MTKLPLSLLLVLFTLGTTHLPAAEPADSLTPDPQDSITKSVTERGVTLTVTCPKVMRRGYANYLLMTVKNDNEQPVSFEPCDQYRLGIRFDIRRAGERHGWTTISLPGFDFLWPSPIEKGQEFKVLVYPTRYYQSLKPGKYDLRAYWEGTLPGTDGAKIKLDLKPMEFEYQGEPLISSAQPLPSQVKPLLKTAPSSPPRP